MTSLTTPGCRRRACRSSASVTATSTPWTARGWQRLYWWELLQALRCPHPVALLQACTSLVEVDLSFNRLGEWMRDHRPQQALQHSLETVRLDSTELREAPLGLGALESLREVYLYSNELPEQVPTGDQNHGGPEACALFVRHASLCHDWLPKALSLLVLGYALGRERCPKPPSTPPPIIDEWDIDALFPDWQ